MLEKEQNNQGAASGGCPFQLRLRSIRSSRQTYARICRERGKGTLDEKVYRSLLYGLNGYLAFLKLEKEEDLEVRITALEKIIKEQNRDRY